MTSPAPAAHPSAARLPAPRQGLLARVRAAWQSRRAIACGPAEAHPLSDLGFVRLPDPARNLPAA